VAETLIWFMERWSKTFLLVNENDYGFMSPNIAKSFGQPGPSDGQGVHILEFFIEQMKSNFMLWNADPDVLSQLVRWLNVCGTSLNLKSTLVQSSKLHKSGRTIFLSLNSHSVLVFSARCIP
jgi:hypothetical protein